jgi:ADP-ribose pyrophosphatase
MIKPTAITNSKKLIETTLKSKEIYDGRLLNVFVDTIRLPDGSQSTRDWIRHPGACAIVPVFDDQTVMLIQQFRYPMKQIFYEVPAGKIDSGESAESTARRELEEECGLICNNLDYAGHFYPGIGYSDEVIHVYVATGLKEISSKTDDDEFVINHRIPFKEAQQMISDGIISDGKTICAFNRTINWWKKNNPFPLDSI